LNSIAPSSPLALRLSAPERRLRLEELIEVWFQQTVTVRMAGNAALADDPVFPGRVRGALGHALMAGASAESLRDEPCPWDPPCAYDLLFREHARIAGGLVVPRPMVPAVDPIGRDLAVRLSLFGFSCDWLSAAADALSAAVRLGVTPPRLGVEVTTKRDSLAARRPGVATEPGRDRVVSRVVETLGGPTVPLGAVSIALDFLSPVSLRGSTHPAEGAAGFVGALLNRVMGLARWHDAEVEIDRSALLAAADRVRVDASGLEPVAWRRGSTKQDRELPMAGEVGTLYLEGPLDPLLPLLALGERVHVGARASFGQGRYRLRVVA